MAHDGNLRHPRASPRPVYTQPPSTGFPENPRPGQIRVGASYFGTSVKRTGPQVRLETLNPKHVSFCLGSGFFYHGGPLKNSNHDVSFGPLSGASYLGCTKMCVRARSSIVVLEKMTLSFFLVPGMMTFLHGRVLPIGLLPVERKRHMGRGTVIQGEGEQGGKVTG